MSIKAIEKILEKVVISQNDLVTETKITEIEKTINSKLPEYYLNFLKKINGDALVNSKKIFEGIPENRTDYFGTFDSVSNIVSNYKNLLRICEEFEIGVNPKEVLIIGNTLNGIASIAIGLNDNNKGSIYWLDGSDLDDIIFIKISNSFSEFLELLLENPTRSRSALAE